MHLDVLAVVHGFSHPGTGNERKDYPYICPTPGAITICAYDMCPEGVLPDRKDIVLYEECGFNSFIQENGSEAFFDRLFNLIEGSGLKAIISNGDLRGSLTEKRNRFVERFKGRDNLGGWEMQDEPLFDALSTQGKIYSEIFDMDSLHNIHFNLVGEMARSFVGRNTPDLMSYLDTVRHKVFPGMWSFDCYPVKRIGNGPVVVDSDVFYSALEAYSRISKVTGRPFWSCCLSMGFRQNEICKPSPTEEHLRFAAFSALAYGAQGIAYWTYRQRADVPGSSFIHLDAPVDTLGGRTNVWYALKKVNQEIKKCNHVFYGSEVVGVFHTGVKKFKDTRPLTGGVGPFATLDGGNAGMLVSHIRNSGGDYIVIVNHDVERNQKVRFSLEDGRQIRAISISDGGKMKMSASKGKFTLGAGGYIIFSYS